MDVATSPLLSRSFLVCNNYISRKAEMEDLRCILGKRDTPFTNNLFYWVLFHSLLFEDVQCPFFGCSPWHVQNSVPEAILVKASSSKNKNCATVSLPEMAPWSAGNSEVVFHHLLYYIYLHIYTYIYIYLNTHTHIYIYTHTHIRYVITSRNLSKKC